MKVIVIQRHYENLSGIKAKVSKIDGERAEEILFTSDPNEVLTMVEGSEPVFVVTGQMLGVVHWYGTDLAREVKRINPNALVFMYSVMPSENEAIDGLIPKEDGTIDTGEHSLLARLLASDLEGATAESIRAAFPEIQHAVAFPA